MNQDKIKQIIEATLFAHGKAMSIDQILKVFEDEEKPERNDIKSALEVIAEEWQGRSVYLKEVASGYRFQVQEDVTPWVARLWEEKPAKYSRAILETLALIAYRQPITRGEIEEIRGVSVSSHITKTLMERDWIRVVGHKDVPGRPALYATTKVFLDYFGLTSLEQLPPLSEIRDLDLIAAELEKSQDEAVENAMQEASGDEDYEVINEAANDEDNTDELMEMAADSIREKPNEDSQLDVSSDDEDIDEDSPSQVEST